MARSARRALFDEEHTPPTINWLKHLVRAGYVPDHSDLVQVPSALWLKHPSDRALEPNLILFPNGGLVGSIRRGQPQLHIRAEDDDGFGDFVSKVPRPTIWERSADLLGRAFVYFALGLLTLLAMAVTRYLER